jgi:hypothetical protein
MEKPIWRRYAAAASLAVLASSAPVAGQSASADPWSRVSPLPTGCYFDAADNARFDKVDAALVADLERQKTINEEVRKQFDALDGRAKMQRIQAFMMKDPQKAMAMMQAMQAGAARITSGVQTASTEGPKLEAEVEALHAKFRSETTALLEPFDEKAAAFAKAHTKVTEGGDYFPNKADEAQWKLMLQERNAAYDKVCANWWNASGPVHAWAGRYKTSLANEAKSYEAQDDAIVMQVQMMDSPSGGYRSLYQLEYTRRYAAKVRSVFYSRPDKGLTNGWLLK